MSGPFFRNNDGMWWVPNDLRCSFIYARGALFDLRTGRTMKAEDDWVIATYDNLATAKAAYLMIPIGGLARDTSQEQLDPSQEERVAGQSQMEFDRY